MTGTLSGRSLVVAIFLFNAAGCVSVSPMDAGLNALMGESVDTAIAVLGKPTEVEGLGRDTLHIWTASRIELRSEQHAIESRGDTPGAMATYPGPRTSAVVSYEHYCNLRLLVDPRGRIIKWAHDGNRSGCRDYNKALKAYAEQARARRSN